MLTRIRFSVRIPEKSGKMVQTFVEFEGRSRFGAFREAASFMKGHPKGTIIGWE